MNNYGRGVDLAVREGLAKVNVVIKAIGAHNECPECNHPFITHSVVKAKAALLDGTKIDTTLIICNIEDCPRTIGKSGVCYDGSPNELVESHEIIPESEWVCFR